MSFIIRLNASIADHASLSGLGINLIKTSSEENRGLLIHLS